MNTTEGAAYGAAVLAALGAGWFGSASRATGAWIGTAEPITPGDADAYRALHVRYRGLYAALRPTFHAAG